MLLNNYYKLMQYRTIANFCRKSSLAISPIITADGVSRVTFGYGSNGGMLLAPFCRPYQGVIRQGYCMTTASSNVTSNYGNLIIGSGTTPVTADDYMMEQEITTVTYITLYTTYNVEEGTVTVVKTMRNETTETISISEIGYAEPFMPTTSGGAYQLLTYREVYDTPVLVAPGETFSVTMTVNVPLGIYTDSQ